MKRQLVDLPLSPMIDCSCTAKQAAIFFCGHSADFGISRSPTLTASMFMEEDVASHSNCANSGIERLHANPTMERSVVYIWGNLTVDNFTPRSGKDTIGKPGQKAGLSAWDEMPLGKKAQGIDINMLNAPLRAIPDDTAQGGLSGHFAIVPVDETGEVNFWQLEDWAMSRGTGQTHELTQLLLNAVVQPNVKGGTS